MFNIINSALSGVNMQALLMQVPAQGNIFQQWGMALSQPEEQNSPSVLKLEQMQQRHDEVVAHEEAHAAVGGAFAGAPSYTFEIGPDGEGYAVAGEVPIDISEVSGDPHATYHKMLVVEAAALAPAEPSGQDMMIAGTASSLATKALNEISMMESQPAMPNNFLNDVFNPSSIFGSPLF